MKIGLAADHGGFELKEKIQSYLLSMGHDVKDYGATELNNTDDFPDYVIPLAQAVANKEVERGVAICGSGVGASVAANKIKHVRAALVNDHYSAHQGVEDDDLNVLCLGGRVTGLMVAQELIQSFLSARFKGEERHIRRLQKVTALEK